MLWTGILPGTEAPEDQSWRKAVHSLSASEMIQELFQLLSIFNGDEKTVASFEQRMTVVSSREDPIFTLRLTAIEPMVTKLLVDTAARNRWRADSEIDANREVGRPNANSGPWSVQVGTIRFESEDWQALTLRESCNKIIHAEDIQPEFSKGSLPYLTGLIRTSGRLSKRRWRTEIDLTNYVRASIYTTYGGIDFTRGWMRL